MLLAELRHGGQRRLLPVVSGWRALFIAGLALALGCTAGVSHSIGGTTGGAPDAGCQSSSGGAASVSCESSSQCACPLMCGVEPTRVTAPEDGRICLAPCVGNADCADPRTGCADGLCLVTVCADGGPYDGSCDSSDAGDGTCLPSQDASGNSIGVCVQGGTATTACDLVGARENPAGLCGVGSVCLSFQGGGMCAVACDPAVADAGCGPDALCLSPNGAAPGGCVPLGPNGCLTLAPKATLLEPCTTTSDCACPQACVADPGSGGSLCKLSCTTTADCANATTGCVAGSCAPIYCAVDPLGEPVDGGFGQACAFPADGGIGLCAPLPASVSTPAGSPAFAYGLCVASGTAPLGAACDLISGRSLPNLLCSAGAYCTAIIERTGDFCAQTCVGNVAASSDAGAAGGCPAGQGCFAIYRGTNPELAPEVGVCQSCTASGTTCFADGECCSQSCADAGSGGSKCD